MKFGAQTIVGFLLAIIASSSSCGSRSADADEVSDLEAYSGSNPHYAYGIFNFRRVNSKVLRSGHLQTNDYAKLRKLGVKSILSLEGLSGSVYASTSEPNMAAAYGMASHFLPLSPTTPPTIEQINKAISFIEDPRNHPILVHCKNGVDRTGIVIAAYRVKYYHWSADKAKSEMRRLGHNPKLYWWDDIVDQYASTMGGVNPPPNTSGTGEEPPGEPSGSSSDPEGSSSSSNSSGSGNPSDGEQIPDAPVIGEVALQGNRNIAAGLPFMPSQPEVLISRAQYVISWNKKRRVPNWVAWELRRSDLGSVDRQNEFAVDPALRSFLQAKGEDNTVGPEEFQGSCLDRGHQIPSADRTASVGDNEITFFMSNMVPQAAYLNRVVWERVESYARSLVRHDGSSVYVIAGSIFDANASTIGSHRDIAVPSKNFKIIIKSVPGQRPRVVAAVILPNTTSTGTNPLIDRRQACEDTRGSFDMQGWGSAPGAWRQYEVPVDQIESEAGIDLSFAKAM